MWYNHPMKTTLNKAEILSLLRRHMPMMQERFGVRSLALIGSFARNEATEESDVDLIVDMPSSYRHFFELQRFLETELKRRVDLGLEHSLRSFIKNRIRQDAVYV